MYVSCALCSTLPPFLPLSPSFLPPSQQNTGFQARLATNDSAHSGINHARTIRRWKATFLFSLIFGVPTILISFAPMDYGSILPGLTIKELVLFILSTIVQVSDCQVIDCACSTQHKSLVY